MIEVDPEPYSDNFARPARLLPVEAKALVAAIDLIGEHLPEGALTSGAREDRRRARRRPDGAGPAGRRTPAATTPRSRASSREAIAERQPHASWSTTSPTRTSSPAHRRALRAHQRARGLVRRVVRPAQGRRPPLPPGPHQGRPRCPRPLQAASGGRSGGRRRRLAAHRRGRGLARRPRLGLARARALGARGAPRRPRSSPTARSSSSRPTRAPTGSCARCCARPATPSCSSPRTRGPPSPARSGGCAASPSAPAEGAAPLRGLARDRRLARRGGRARPETRRRRRHRRPGRRRPRAVPARLPPGRVRGLGH